MTASPPTSKAPDRVQGLDTLRFFLALWVVFSHTHFLPLPEAWTAPTVGLPVKVFRGLYNNFFSGPPAVIVFFVLSGFCIHYPYRHRDSLELLPFFVRRHIRIWLPVIAALALGRLLGMGLDGLNPVLWSLVCEEIYYTLYPGVLKLRRSLGWPRVLGLSFVLAYATVLLDGGRAHGNYEALGGWLTWLLGYPCWLLGAKLAEDAEGLFAQPVPPAWKLWAWRLAHMAFGTFLGLLRFHSPVGYNWSLNLLALSAILWLRVELQVGRVRRSAFFEALGLGSYTLYLSHGVAIHAWERFHLGNYGQSLLPWLGVQALILALALVFYKLIEQPSYQLARKVGNYILQRVRTVESTGAEATQRV